MLEVLVGLIAGLLFVIGLVIIIGPGLPRSLGLARGRTGILSAPRRAPAPSELHPTTVRALAATARLLAILKEQGLDRQASMLRNAGKRLQVEEVSGIHAMRQALRQLRGLRMDDESDERIFRGLIGQLQQALDDRAEQLELLPKN